MKKKMMAAVLAGVMCVTMLAGCGKEETPAAAGSTEQGSSAAGSAPAQSESKDDKTEETVTVKWCMYGDKQPDHDMVMEDLNKKLKEKINVELELEMIPQGEFADKMKLSSTAGEDFDLVFTSNWLNKFDENMSRDAYLPLDDLLEEYGQDLKASIPEWLLDVAKVDGQLYAIPNQQIIARQMGVAIQKEYADKYAFDKTSMADISELYPFLDEIVKNEPGMFPIDRRVEAIVERDYEGLANEMVYIDKNDPDATLIPATVAWDEQLRVDNEWYQKGYIRKDVATITDNSADVKANRYVCTLTAYKPGWDAEFTQRQGIDYITVPIEGAYVKAVSGIETMTAINVNSKHPEAAMKLLNLIHTDKEIFNELLFGIEGVHYNKTGENSVESVEETKYTYGSYAWKFGNQFNAWYMPGQEEGLWEATDKLNNEAQVSVLRGFVFKPDPVQAELAQLAAVFKEFKDGQFTAADIDQYIKDRNDKMEQAGMDAVVQELQKQIDEWKAAQ